MKARSPKSGTNARFRTPSPNHLALTPPPSPSPRQPPWRNHPRSPASNSAGRYVASCRAKSRRRTAGTRAGGSLTFIRSRLKNSKVRYFDDHRIKINQEKCAEWLLVDVIKTFGQKLAFIRRIIFQMTSNRIRRSQYQQSRTNDFCDSQEFRCGVQGKFDVVNYLAAPPMIFAATCAQVSRVPSLLARSRAR